MVYGMATLKMPNVHRAFETLGWQSIGIVDCIGAAFVARWRTGHSI